MNSEKIIYELLYRILIEIRSAAYENNPNLSKIAFHLTDLMHNIPSMIASVHDGKRKSYDEILEYIYLKAEQKGMAVWLTNAIENIKENELSKKYILENKECSGNQLL